MDALDRELDITVVVQVVVDLVAEHDLRCSQVLAEGCSGKPASEALDGRSIRKVYPCRVQRESDPEVAALAPGVAPIREAGGPISEQVEQPSGHRCGVWGRRKLGLRPGPNVGGRGKLIVSRVQHEVGAIGQHCSGQRL